MNKLYVDMDGVLADFESHVKDLFSDKMLEDESVESYINRIGQDEFWSEVETIDDFWITIPPLHDDLPSIWKSLKKRFPHIMILSAPSRDKRCVVQKKEWLQKYIGPDIMALFEKDKYIYACPKSILIDDTESKITDWNNAGGHSIHFTKGMKFDNAFWTLLNNLKANKNKQHIEKQSSPTNNYCEIN